MKKIFSISLSLLILLTTSVFAQWPYDNKPIMGTPINWAHPLSDFIGAWFFLEGSGDKVFDISGNGNTGTFAAGAASPSWSAGKFGMCPYFDGGDYIEVANNSVLNFTTAFSISIWFKYDGATDASYRDLFCKGVRAVAVNGAYEATYHASSDDLYFRVRNTANDGAHWVRWNDMPENQWHHVVCTWDNGMALIYANGIIPSLTYSDGPPAGFTAINTNTSTLRIGFDTTSYYWNGPIDSVLLYNHALTASEVTELYINHSCMFEAEDVALMTVPAAPAVGGQVIIISSVFEGLGFIGLLLLLSWLIKKGFRA